MADLRPDHDAGTPRWVKVFGIIALALVVLFLVLLLNGGGHGPSRHMSFGGPGDGTPPPASVAAAGSLEGHAPLQGGGR